MAGREVAGSCHRVNQVRRELPTEYALHGNGEFAAPGGAERPVLPAFLRCGSPAVVRTFGSGTCGKDADSFPDSPGEADKERS